MNSANDPQSLLLRIAALEEQLAAADAGVTRLAQRCHALEQQVLALTPEETEETQLNLQLTRPSLYFDLGLGYSAQNMIMAPATAFDEKTHTVEAVFKLKKEACALRLDPGELPCYVTNVTFTDPDLTCAAPNGILMEEGAYLFPHADPNFLIAGCDCFPAGTEIGVKYSYYPISPAASDPVLPALMDAFDVQKLAAAGQQAALDAANTQLEAMTTRCLDAEAALNATLNSASWKLTSPLRAVLSVFRKG